MSLISNDTAQLTATTEMVGRTLEFDFPSFEVGVAEYREGPTGCTVFHFPKGAMTVADVRGGACASVFTDPLTTGESWVHAICLAGGSIYGLEAAAGVSAELFARRGYATGWLDMALVTGAVIFDYGRRKNAIYPDKSLGREALKVAQAGVFPQGAHGAGCSATVGNGFDYQQGEPAGQGGAFRQIGPTRAVVFSVVNALGAIVDRQGQVVRGHLDQTGVRRRLEDDLQLRLESGGLPSNLPGHTTLTVLVVNQKLSGRSLRQIARQVHSSMARAIQPFHTIYDGDILFAVTTNEVENAGLNEIGLGVIASELAWDAVLNCFEESSPG